MKTKRYPYLILITLATVLIVTLACNLPIAGIQRSDDTDALSSPLQPPILDQNNQNFDSLEHFSYQITEAQLSAILREGLANRPELGISNPVVYLRDGSVEIQADVEYSGLVLPMTVNLILYVDADNKLQYEISSAKLGPLPIPQAILDQFSGLIDQSIEQSLGMDQENVKFESVLIENGVLSISGYISG